VNTVWADIGWISGEHEVGMECDHFQHMWGSRIVTCQEQDRQPPEVSTTAIEVGCKFRLRDRFPPIQERMSVRRGFGRTVNSVGVVRSSVGSVSWEGGLAWPRG
jgi:hypothetical protein